LYRVGFLSPLQAVLSLQYRTRSGWRFNPYVYWDDGYPIGAGTTTAAFINGVPYNIPNTNASINSTAPVGAPSYVDPLNPGSLFNPNIIATRGTPEGSSAGGKLSSYDLYVNMTVEWTSPKNYTLGFTVNNIFNQLYGGSYVNGLNGLYQPIATGISGPLSGVSFDPNAYASFGPSLGLVSQYADYVHGREAYINAPQNYGRNFYVYFQTKI
jgi:hypothetical protein